MNTFSFSQNSVNMYGFEDPNFPFTVIDSEPLSVHSWRVDSLHGESNALCKVWPALPIPSTVVSIEASANDCPQFTFVEFMGLINDHVQG